MPTFVRDLDENKHIHTVLQGVTCFAKAVKAKPKRHLGGGKTNSAVKMCQHNISQQCARTLKTFSFSALTEYCRETVTHQPFTS